MALKVAIVGRPNVGKSTLFNRLAGKKLAIVDDQPGVTRDRRFAKGRIGDLELILIDTAGFEDLTDESLESRMRRQTELAIEECDVALFVMDAREGATPLDGVFAEILRRTSKAVILAANKAEGRAGEAGALEAFQLGLGEPISISAEHGEGMADLYAAFRVVSDQLIEEDDEDEDGEKPIRIAIVGRPNAGKSTLVNRLIGEERLLTGPEAGITRDAIPVDWTFEGQEIRLVDTAGLRRKARIHEKLEKLSTGDTIRAITFAEVVILVMDATHPFEIQDLQIADLIEREGRGLVFALAKWDLVEDQQAQLAAFKEHAERMLPQVRGTPVIALSGETGKGVDRLMPAVTKVYKDWSTKIKTRDLNAGRPRLRPATSMTGCRWPCNVTRRLRSVGGGSSPNIWLRSRRGLRRSCCFRRGRLKCPKAIGAIWSTVCAKVSTFRACPCGSPSSLGPIPMLMAMASRPHARVTSRAVSALPRPLRRLRRSRLQPKPRPPLRLC
ncbi:MAG: hypothetical protein RLZZ141_1711 [Pseudomonadota bacterium]